MKLASWLKLGLMAASTPSCMCFVRGTRISTPRGPRPIEDLKIGDEVWSWSFAEGRAVRRRILAAMRRDAESVLRLRAGEHVLSGVTPTHPVWNNTSGAWSPAGALEPGDELLAWLEGGGSRGLRLDSVDIVPEAAEVFNLTVDGEHVYFAEGILVHNKSPAEWPDHDADGVVSTQDCDDYDPAASPDADEICDDETDNDCDGDIDADDEDCRTS